MITNPPTVLILHNRHPTVLLSCYLEASPPPHFNLIELIGQDQWKQYLPEFTPITVMTSASAHKLHSEATEQATASHNMVHIGHDLEQFELLEMEQPLWTDPNHPEMHLYTLP